MSEEVAECRICFEPETIDDPFLSPCMCKGTSKYVHTSCLTTWRHFNRDREGWKRCMECGEEYTIRYRYPVETTTIFKKSSHPAVIYFFQYIMALTSGSMIWLIDSHNNYLAIRMLNFNIHLKSPSLLTYIKEDELAPQIFYFSFAVFLQSIGSYIYFYYVIKMLIHRKDLYFTKMKSSLFCCILFSMQFIIWYYILVFTNNSIAYLNVISFLAMVEPFLYYSLIKKHNNVIKLMNEENQEEVLSYEENPLLDRNNDNILRRNFELRNIIINN